MAFLFYYIEKTKPNKMKKNFYFALTILIIVILACSKGKRDEEDNEDYDTPKDKTEEVKDEEEKVQEKIIYNIPFIIENLDIVLIPVTIVDTQEEDWFGRIKEYIDGSKRTVSTYSKRYSMFNIDNLYNVIFFNKTTEEEYPLLNKRELINNFYIPISPTQDTLQAKTSNFILFTTIDNDYNGDGDIDVDDGETIYLCDIYGKNKKQISNKNISLIKWEIDTKYDILFLLIKEDSDSDKKFTVKDDIKILKTSISNPGMSVEVVRDSLHNEMEKIYE